MEMILQLRRLIAPLHFWPTTHLSCDEIPTYHSLSWVTTCDWLSLTRHTLCWEGHFYLYYHYFLQQLASKPTLKFPPKSQSLYTDMTTAREQWIMMMSQVVHPLTEIRGSWKCMKMNKALKWGHSMTPRCKKKKGKKDTDRQKKGIKNITGWKI